MLALLLVACNPIKEQAMMEPTVNVVTQQGKGSGTGVIIDNFDGSLYTVLTAKHVVEENKTVLVQIGESEYTAAVIAASYDRDIALLVVDIKDRIIHPAELCTSPAERFDEVWSVGAGLSNPIFPTKGIVGNTNYHFRNYPDKIVPDTRYIQHSASIAPGNSGGPLFKETLFGYCVTGINLLGYVAQDSYGRPIPIQQFSFALHLEEIKYFLDNLNKYGRS